MSEEQATEVSESQANIETSPSPSPEPSRPAGYEPVDYNLISDETLREQVKARNDYLYRQIKDQKRTDITLKQYRDIASEQARRIEELTNGFTGVVNHLQEKSTAETEASLKAQMRTAYESGDTGTYLTLQDQLDDLRLEKKLAAKEKKEAPRAAPEKIQQFDDGPGLPPEDQSVIDNWQDERDESGSLLRPWAHNRSNDQNKPDPIFEAGLRETISVLGNPIYKNYTMEQKMAEVDRRMGMKKTTPQQNVMGGNLTSARKSGKLTLSPKQQEIAIKTKFGGPKAKSDAEHLDAYRQQLEKSKGARK